MTPYILDTDRLSLYGRNHPALIKRLQVAAVNLTTTAINVEEQLRGRLAQVAESKAGISSTNAYRWLSETVKLLADFEDNPLVVQRRGGFGYTLAKSICPTLRAQTGGHQGGHSDRPILCGEELDVDRVGTADGVSSRLDGRRGRLIGNAVVPTISEWIGKRILEIEGMSRF